MIRIMLVDDHKVVKNGVESILTNNPKYQVEAFASNGKEALEILQHKTVDIILMDLNMKEMDGITCTRKISLLYPNIKVLAFSMQGDDQSIKKMMAAGAAGYLFKDCEESELTHAIESIINTGKYYNSNVTKTLYGTVAENTKGEKTLTKREKEVIKLVLKEYTNKEIAEHLGISHRTVEIHKRNLLAKTGSRNIAGLVIFAIKNGML